MPTIVRIMPIPAAARRPVVALAYDGLCTFEFGCAVEVFGLPRPYMGPDWYRFAVAAVDEGPMRAVGGIQVMADGGLELLAGAGTIVIPGWRGLETPVPAPLIEALREASAGGARLMTICSGVAVLAATGLLDGKRATTHWHYTSRLARLYPAISWSPDVLYVDEGSLLTSAGSAAGLDLCLHLVRRDHGAQAANRIARRLVVPAQREGGQAQYIERPVPRAAGSRLAPLMDRVRGALGEEWSIARLAAEAALSPRGLHRHWRAATGLAPGEWLLAERLARAKELLETSRLTVDSIAEQSGFGSAAALRLQFREKLGISPRDWRRQFVREPLPGEIAAI
ncbi:transcriptional regulator FtrA [Acetobacteraceae bacterium H6797]|nr:transcriptional regulator FtrA [Acetobacteraceae bacterium H6797]